MNKPLVRLQTENCPHTICYCGHFEGIQTCDETYEANVTTIPLDATWYPPETIARFLSKS